MLIDVTRPIHAGMALYPGDPPVRIEPVASVARDGYAVSRLALGTHTGTHLDPPAHFIARGPTVDQAPLDLLVGPARVVAVSAGPEVTRAAVEAMELTGVQRLLFRTAGGAGSPSVRAAHGPPDRPPHRAWLSAAAARLLAELGVRLIGIDTLSVDPLEFPAVSAHAELLGRGVWILENLDLSAVTPGEYEMFCLPLKIAAGDGAPARVLLRSPDE
jgi:arylformamidase